MLREWIYPKIESPLKSGARWLHEKGITFNQLKLGSLVLNLVAACLLLNGKFALAGIIIVLAGASDVFSEILTQEPCETTSFRTFLGSLANCYSEFFLYSGLVLHFAREQQAIYLWLSLGVLTGSCAVNYLKVRAENFIENGNTGIFDRTTRITILIIGTFLSVLLPLMLWILCIGTHTTALWQLLHVKKQLNSSTEETGESNAE